MERSADDKSLWISPETHSEILRTEKKLSSKRKCAADYWKIRAQEAEKEAEELRGQLRKLGGAGGGCGEGDSSSESTPAQKKRKKKATSEAVHSGSRSRHEKGVREFVSDWVEENFRDGDTGWEAVLGVLDEKKEARLRASIMQEVKNDLAEHWSTEWAAALKLRLGLSEEKWDVLAESIVGTFVPSDDPSSLGHWQRRLMAGTEVQLPRPPKRTAVLALLKKLSATVGLRATNDGEVATCDFEALFEEELAKAKKQHPAVFNDADFVLEVQFLADALQCWCGINITNIVFRLPQFVELANSPRSVTLIGCWLGKDSYDNIKKATAPIQKWMKKVVFEDGGKVSGINIRLTGGGDLVFMRDALGITTRFCDKKGVCNFCDADKDKIRTTELGKQRTYAGLCHNAHCFANDKEQSFTCPTCKKQFNRTNHSKEKQPAEKNFRQTHGQDWHKPPLFVIEPVHFYVCIMHMCKTVITFLFYHCVGVHIKTEEQSEKVRKALIARGVQMPQRMIAVKKQKEQMEYIKKPSLQGIEDRQVLEAMVWMIETVAPETVRKNKEQNAKLRKLVRAVEQWRNEIYSPINTKLPSPAQLKEKANKVHSLAVSMHSEFMSAVHKVVPYIHHALHTEQWEHADLRDRSGEAMEAKGKQMKQRGKQTNGRIQGDKQSKRTSPGQGAIKTMTRAEAGDRQLEEKYPKAPTRHNRRSLKRLQQEEGGGRKVKVKLDDQFSEFSKKSKSQTMYQRTHK